MNYNRTLVDSEQAMERLNQNKGTLNVVVISKLVGRLNAEILRQALDLIQAVNPRLNSRIVCLDKHLNFITEGTEKIPLRVVIQNHSQGWQDILTEELNHSIDSSRCLLRCVLIQDASETNKSYLLTTVHHGITDGISSINLHQEILKYCQFILSGRPIDCDPINVLPPVDELLPSWMKGNQGFIQGIIFLLKMKWQLFKHQPEVLEGEKTVPIQFRQCGIASRYLEKDLTQKLIQLCRQENTTIQGALCAAMLMTVADKIRKGKSRDINLSCRSYVDLRRRMIPPIRSKETSFLASFITSLHLIKNQTSFWDLARNVTNQVELKIKKQDIFKPLKFLKKIINFYLKHPDELSLTISVTNVGRVELLNFDENLVIEEISFAVSNVVFGRILTVAVTTFQDKMILNFIVSQPSISEDTLNHLANGVIQYLTQICQT